MLSLSERIWRSITALLGLGAVVTVGVIAETKADGGFLKDMWEGLKTPSPVISMLLGYGIMILWREWQRDRREHADRTIEYNKTLNRYSRLLEKAVERRRRGTGREAG